MIAKAFGIDLVSVCLWTQVDLDGIRALRDDAIDGVRRFTPTVCLAHLDAAQRRAYVLADNMALNAGWDHELLAMELHVLMAIDFDIEFTEFSPAEIDLVPDEVLEGTPNGRPKRKPKTRSRSVPVMPPPPSPGRDRSRKLKWEPL